MAIVNRLCPIKWRFDFPLNAEWALKVAPIAGLHEICRADRTGLEPATSAVTGRHSNQLNYRSVPLMRGWQR